MTKKKDTPPRPDPNQLNISDLYPGQYINIPNEYFDEIMPQLHNLSKGKTAGTKCQRFFRTRSGVETNARFFLL